MNKHFILSAAIVLAANTTARADGEPKAQVSGEQRSEIVANITFDDENVVLHYVNGTSETVDMENVIITFSKTTAIQILNTEAQESPMQYFDLSGHQLKQAPQQGSYIMKKGNKVVKLIKK